MTFDDYQIYIGVLFPDENSDGKDGLEMKKNEQIIMRKKGTEARKIWAPDGSNPPGLPEWQRTSIPGLAARYEVRPAGPTDTEH